MRILNFEDSPIKHRAIRDVLENCRITEIDRAMYLDDGIEMYKKAIETDSKYICCGYNKIYSNRKEPINSNGEIDTLTKREFLISLLNVQNSYGFVHMKLINKTIIKDIRFNEKITVGEDALFNVELCKQIDNVVIFKKALYNYRINLNSVVRKYDPNYVKKYTDSMILMTNYIKDNYGNDIEINANLNNYIIYHLMLICVNYCYNPSNKKKYKSLKNVCKTGIYKKAIKHSNYNDLSLSRKITLFTMKMKFYIITALICRIRQKQIRK